MSEENADLPLTPLATAALIDDIAEKVESGDDSIDLQVALQDVSRALQTTYEEGALLAHRLAVQLRNPAQHLQRYPDVLKLLQAMPPFERRLDAEALRRVAERLRQNDRPALD